jgi:TonB-linked SusC/RagA family outer membrane protein
MLFSAAGVAQSVQISGTVVESGTGMPVPGTNVIVRNSPLNTATDLDGRFTLAAVPVGSVVVFSYLGYTDVEYTVTGANSAISITLREDNQVLDEVVVIGYGTQRRSEVTGAVGVLSAKTIDQLRPVRVEQALQGTVSGVLLTSQGGSPGAGFNISIRGVSTNGVNAPIVIIDGYQGSMDQLNPQDVESITVLKDAQAAIYGTIGANGVILVTTKKGRKNSPTSLSYNGYTGFQQTTRKLPLLNATEYALLLNESYANGGQPIPFPNVSGLGAGTNWQDEVFGDAPIISHDFMLSGGSEKITYAVSGSDLTQQGIIGGEKSHYKRNTARIQLGADLTSKLKLQSNFIYTYMDRDGFNDFGLGSVLFNAVNAPPTLGAFDANGAYTLIPNTPGLGIEIINPLAQLANTFNDYDLNRLNGTVTLDYEIIKDLVVTGRLGATSQNSKSRSFSPIISYGGKVFDVTRSSVTQGAVNDNSYTLDVFANYKRSFAESHNFAVTVGTTVYKTWGQGLFATGYDVPNNSWQFADISLAQGLGTSVPVSSYSYDDRRNSQFVRLQYNYKERYLVSFMERRDASTFFGPDNAIAYFPSMTAGWVISNEPFYGTDKFVNFLKLRGSYGLLGNDQIGANRYLGQLSGEATYVFNNQLVNGTAVGVLPNPNIGWEESRKTDIGLDFNMMNNKLQITTDWYHNETAGLLVERYPVSATTGVGAPGAGGPTINAGNTRNRGFEIGITYNERLSDNFDFTINGTMSTIDNEVTALSGANNFIEQGAFGVGQSLIPTRMEVGHSIGYFYGYQTDGIFQNQAEVDAHPSQAALGAPAAPGDIRFRDINGDGVINPSDRTDLGDPIPDMIVGFNIQTNYKNFDFVAFAYASVGNDLIRNYERTLSDVNRLDYVLDRWTGEGTSTTVPRVTTAATSNNVFSDYFVEDASYLRIQNVQLGYTLNKEFTKRSRIERVRVYAGVNNLYTFTKYRGFDPGSTSGGSITAGNDIGTYPIARTFLFGVNLNF